MSAYCYRKLFQSYLYLNFLLHRQKSPSLSISKLVCTVTTCWLFKFSAATCSCLSVLVFLCFMYSMHNICTDTICMTGIYFPSKVLSVYLVIYKINAVNMCNKSNVILISVNLICI